MTDQKKRRLATAKRHIQNFQEEKKQRNKKTDAETKRKILISRAMQAKAYARAIDAERDAEYYLK